MIGKRLAFNRNLRWATTKLPFLTHYIYLYHQKFRPQLLMGNAQDFLFLAKSGTPFSASSYSNISALFEKHFSVKLTTNDLRKCIVDYFLSLPASGDHTLRYFLFHCKRWGRRLGMLLRKQDMSHISDTLHLFLLSHLSVSVINLFIQAAALIQVLPYSLTIPVFLPLLRLSAFPFIKMQLPHQVTLFLDPLNNKSHFIEFLQKKKKWWR